MAATTEVAYPPRRPPAGAIRGADARRPARSPTLVGLGQQVELRVTVATVQHGDVPADKLACGQRLQLLIERPAAPARHGLDLIGGAAKHRQAVACHKAAVISGMQGSVTVTSGGPLSWVLPTDLGLRQGATLHGMKGVRVQIPSAPTLVVRR